MTNTSAIELNGLGHFYKSGHWVLRQIGARIRRGEVYAVLGPNGRGKTTLINILLGILSPREGRAEVNGTLGFVPQLFMPSFPYSVLEIVLMGRARHIGPFSTPGRHDRQVAQDMLGAVGLADLGQRRFTELSGGQRQMVMLARALASEGDILILDEPTAALDLRNQGAILDLIGRLADEHGLTVMFTTHQPQHALAVADSAMLLMEDRPPLTGPVAQIMTEETLAQLYGIGLRRVRVEHQGAIEESFVPLFGTCRKT